MSEHRASRGPHDDEPDGEYDRVEGELADLFHKEFGIARGDLGLTEAQQRVSDRNAAAALVHINASPRSAPTTAASLRVGRRRWFPTAAIAGAAAAAVAVGLVIYLPGAPSPIAYASMPPLLQVDGSRSSSYPLTGTNADPHLERLARLAGSQPPVPGTGDIERITRLGWWLDTDETEAADGESPSGRPKSGGEAPDSADSERRRVVPVRTETLQLPDGVTRIRVQRGEPLQLDGELEVDASDPVTSDETFPRDPDNPLDFPDRLPTHPAALRAALLGPDADCGGIEAYCLFESMSTLNLNFVLDPALEAGLIRSLVGASDIGYAGLGRDRLGREVEVFVVDDPDHQRQYLLLFDARTGFYAGDETVLIVAQPDLLDVEVPAVIEFAAITGRSRITAADAPE